MSKTPSLETRRQRLQTMLEADSLVIIFPLYIYSLPGILMRFLQDFYAYYLVRSGVSKVRKVFAVINCGFPEPEICSGGRRSSKASARKSARSFASACRLAAAERSCIRRTSRSCEKQWRKYTALSIS
jgi:putative NADPH-quinone reductase